MSGEMGGEGDRRLRDERDISALVTRYARGLDDADWDDFRGCFDEEVEIDTSGFRGVPPSILPRDAWVDRVRSSVELFDKVLHYSSNHLVEIDGDEGACHSYALNVHEYRRDDVEHRYVVNGRYTHKVRRTEAGWRVSGVRLIFVMSEGSPPPPKG